MSRIQLPKTEDLASATVDTLESVRKSVGMIPNLLSTLAHSPVALLSYLNFSNDLKQGQLTAQQREIIALAVAQFNQCEYCLSAHSLMAKGAGLSPAAIHSARQGGEDDSIDSVIAAFAKQLVDSRGVIGDGQFEQYQKQGLSQGLMLEIVAHVALNTFSNYVNHLAATDIDFPKISLEV